MAKLLERRRSDRFEVNAEFAELEPGSISFVNNLSESGVFVSTRTRLPPRRRKPGDLPSAPSIPGKDRSSDCKTRRNVTDRSSLVLHRMRTGKLFI